MNDDPVATPDRATTPEDSAIDIDVLANDSDVDGDVLTVISVTQGSNGSVTINLDGTIRYTHDPDYNGTNTFTSDQFLSFAPVPHVTRKRKSWPSLYHS